MAENKKLYDIIYQDEDFIIINKSPDVLTIPERFFRDTPNLRDILKNELGEIFVVHRLDKETSGVICFAKNKEAHKYLNRVFEYRNVEKKYLALVKGCPENDEGKIKLPIIENPGKQGTMIIDYKRGKKSVTQYKVIEKFKFCSLVEAILLTGRMHQIRIHFMGIDNPLLVDKIYSDSKAVYLSDFKKHYKIKKYEDEKPIMHRLTLHSQSLSFFHFRKNEQMTFEAPLPKDFLTMLKHLRKYA